MPARKDQLMRIAAIEGQFRDLSVVDDLSDGRSLLFPPIRRWLEPRLVRKP
jgi:hypothetical protein